MCYCFYSGILRGSWLTLLFDTGFINNRLEVRTKHIHTYWDRNLAWEPILCSTRHKYVQLLMNEIQSNLNIHSKSIASGVVNTKLWAWLKPLNPGFFFMTEELITAERKHVFFHVYAMKPKWLQGKIEFHIFCSPV